MARLIDANVVLAKQFTTGLSDASGNYYGHADVVFVDDIENATTVDAVEVVRCRECKYHEDTSVTEYEHCCLLSKTVRYNDFCSYGDRKEGAGNG